MQIKLITQEVYEELEKLQIEHPELTFQNVGYQYIGREVRDGKAKEIARIEDILKEHVTGFGEFFNFQLRDKGNATRDTFLRFDYNWGAADNTLWFRGVGYLNLRELRDGLSRGQAQA